MRALVIEFTSMLIFDGLFFALFFTRQDVCTGGVHILILEYTCLTVLYVEIYALFPQIFCVTEKQTPQTYSLLECMNFSIYIQAIAITNLIFTFRR